MNEDKLRMRSELEQIRALVYQLRMELLIRYDDDGPTIRDNAGATVLEATTTQIMHIIDEELERG